MDYDFFNQRFNASVVATVLNMWANGRLPVTADPQEKLTVADAAFLLYGLSIARPGVRFDGGSIEGDINRLHADILADGLKPGWHRITSADTTAHKVVTIIAIILADELGADQPLSELEEMKLARGFVSTTHKGGKKAGFGRVCIEGEEFETVTLPGAWVRQFVSLFVE